MTGEAPAAIDQRPRIAGSLGWTYLSVIVSGGMQLVMLAVLARLLRPEEFGIVASTLLFLRAGQILVQSGYERAVIFVEQATPELTTGLFWLSMTTGLVLSGAFALAAPLLGTAIGDPRIAAATMPLSWMIAISSLGLVARGLLRRQMRFRALGLLDTASYGIGFLCVGLPLALTGWGITSLIAANLVQAALQGVLPFVIARHSITTRFSIASVRHAVSFSYGVSGLGLIEFIDSQITTLFVARWYGMQAVGIYSRGYALVQLPLEQLGTSLSRVLFSSFNTEKADTARLNAIYLPALTLSSVVIFPLALGGGSVGALVVEVMLGPGWQAAAPIFTALCIGTSCAVVGNLVATLNEALGLIRQKTVIQTAITVALAVGLLASAGHGVVLAAALFSVARVAFLFAQLELSARALGLQRSALLAQVVPGVLIGIGVAAANVLLGIGLPGLVRSPALQLAVHMLLSGVAWLGLATALVPAIRDFARTRLARRRMPPAGV